MALILTVSNRRSTRIIKSINEVYIATLLVLTTFVCFGMPATADDTESKLSRSDARKLDGLMFSARIVREGGEEGKQIADELTFRDGMFSSEICKRYNFSDAPYWVRLEGEKLYFLAELNSPTDGTMVWKGSINGNTLEGTMRWTKKRWYWTVDTEHRIRGNLEEIESDYSATVQ